MTAADEGTGTAAGAPLAALAAPDAWPALATALGDWLVAQRWFQGKARAVTGVRVADAALLAAEPGILLLVLDVAYATGSAEQYQVLLTAADGRHPPVATVAGIGLADALDDPGACRALAVLTLGAARCRTGVGGDVRGEPVAPGTRPAGGDVRRLGVEQSNSSVVLGRRQILKVFRRLEEGLNPDVEVTRGLTQQGFDHVPAQLGALILHAGEGQRALAVLSAFADGARDGWAVACAEAERVAAGDGGGSSLSEGAADLGAVVARMHVALRDGFGARAARPGEPRAWAESMQQQARAVLAGAAARAPEAAAGVVGASAALLERLAAPAALDDVGPLVRTHGDLHLGQVLADDHTGWLVLDFEGEPARPLAERRVPHSPLRDVAGMLRSFDYAAAHADPSVPPALASWRDRLRAAFWDGYVAVAEPAGLLPGAAATAALLAAFELDKAVYELGYELANRPGWVGIPVGGILRVLDATR